MNHRVVLCVDDEVNILHSLKRLLRKEPYRLLTATSGEDGLQLLRKEIAQLVISDQRMPGMTGVEFLQKVKEMYPDTVRVVISGYASAGVIVEAINKGEIYRFMPKPWIDEELKIAIQQCFEHYDLLRQNQDLLEQVQLQNEELKELNEGLEEMVKRRTLSLQLSQKILEKIPLSVLGVSQEGMIVLINERASRMFPSSIHMPLGLDVRLVFPPDVAEHIVRSLTGENSEQPLVFQFYEQPVRMKIETLKEQGSIMGSILMMAGV